MKIVNVELGERSYPIYVQSGLSDQLARFLGEHHLDQQLFLITDENVQPLYGERILAGLQDGGMKAERIVAPAGERSKSLQQANEIYTRLLENHADRNSVIIALGGGVVGDLAGFVAATFMRGVPFVQVPTTVLSQVDSSVGGKVGVNHALGKNLIGAFYQPKFVLIDPDTLTTLPQREIRAGYAEVIKYGFIHDRDFYQTIAAHLDQLFALENHPLLEQILYTSCRVKADVVSRDEKEAGVRATLNFGHTIGHAIEATAGYGRFLHGEAIVHGMVAALHLSYEAGLLSHDSVENAAAVLARFHAPALPAEIHFDDLMAAMQKDKKRSSAGQLWVLLEEVGRSVLTRDVSDAQINRAVDFMLAQSSAH